MSQDEVVHTAVTIRDEPTTPSGIQSLMQIALEKNVDVAMLERLVALHERVTDRQAASEFATALAQFQSECPPITKTSRAKVVGQSGTSFEYTYAELSHIANTVGPLLHSKGFSYSWDSKIEDKLMSCTVTLRHANGHEKKASFACPTDTRAGMSDQQKFAAALSYAKRQSLVQVLGITTADPDTDGANPEVISKEQVAELRMLADEVKADVKKFLGYMGYPTFEEIRKTDFNRARTALNAKRKAATK